MLLNHPQYVLVAQRSRWLAWLWAAGHIGQKAGRVGFFGSIVYGAARLLWSWSRPAGAETQWLSSLTGALGGLGVSAALVVLSVVVKSYAAKRAALHDRLFGQEAE